MKSIFCFLVIALIPQFTWAAPREDILRKYIQDMQNITSTTTLPSTPVLFKASKLSPKHLKAEMYKHVVFLDISKNNDEKKYCMGLLLDDRYILTVGHCLNRAKTIIAYRFEDAKLKKLISVRAYKWEAHPNWDGDLNGNPKMDVGIIGLRRAFPMIDSVRVLSAKINLSAYPTAKMTIVSMIHNKVFVPNETDKFKFARLLRTAEVTELTPTSHAAIEYEVTYKNDNTLAYVCGGDSGAPIFIEGNPDFGDKLFYAVGLHTQGHSSGEYVPSWINEIKERWDDKNSPNYCIGRGVCKRNNCSSKGRFIRFTLEIKQWLRDRLDSLDLIPDFEIYTDGEIDPLTDKPL